MQFEPPAHAQLAVDGGQVIAQGVLAHAQFVGDHELLGAGAFHHGHHNVSLTGRQAADAQGVGVNGARRGSGSAAGEQTEHLTKQRAVEPDFAVVHFLDRIQDRLRGLGLVYHPARTFHHRGPVLGDVIGSGQHEHMARAALAQAGEHGADVFAAQIEVEQQHVCRGGGTVVDQFIARTGSAHHFHARACGVDEPVQAPERDVVVLGNEHPDCRPQGGELGTGQGGGVSNAHGRLSGIT